MYEKVAYGYFGKRMVMSHHLLMLILHPIISNELMFIYRIWSCSM